MSKSINSNKQFMIGNGILAFGVIFIVCLFLYLGFRFQQKPGEKQMQFNDVYSIQVDNSFSGDSLNIYINDSLIMSRRFSDKNLSFQIERFAEQSVLMVVESANDKVVPYNLASKGSKVTIKKKNNKIFIEEETDEN